MVLMTSWAIALHSAADIFGSWNVQLKLSVCFRNIANAQDNVQIQESQIWIQHGIVPFSATLGK